jgi:benzylsuccinate CoA-transferase BbsF subunit
MKPDFLKDVCIIDLTWAGAGPFCTKLFSDFGAEVIKIESMTRPDPVRMGGPFRDGIAGTNRSGYFASRNTGKQSVSIDLKQEAGRALVRELIDKADIVSNNFGPGAMDRLGFGYDAVKAIKPDIIYLSMPMYGQSGPRASMLGVGMTISAVTALTWMTAYREGEPVGPGTHYPDHAANPYHAAFAVLAALRYKRQTGRGMNIDLSQVESTLNFVGPALVYESITGKNPPVVGNRSVTAAPHNLFACAGEDQWCAIAVLSDDAWQRVLQVMGRTDLASDARLVTAAGRLAHVDEVEALVIHWTKTRNVDDVVDQLLTADIAAAVVANSRYLAEEDPQLRARGFWQTVDHPEIGESLFTSPPYCVDGERIELERPPLFGEHTDAVLSGHLGYTAQQIEAIRKEGVLR